MRSHALGPQRKGTSCLAQEENCTRTVDTFSSWNNTAVYAVGLLGLPPVATSVAMVKEAARPFPTVSVPDHANYTIGAVILIIGIIGLVGNFLVIYAFSRSRALRTPANLFIINLAIVDFLMCATQSPVFFTASMNKRWIFGEKGCELYAFCGALFGICSMITLMVIAVDRYFVITRPLASIGALSQKRALWVLACAWTYSAGWSLPPFFGWSAYVPEGLLTSCTWDYMTFTPSVRAYTMLLFIFVFFIPLIVIIYCYFFIFRAIRRTKQGVREISGSNTQASVKSSSRLQSEWRMAKVALIAILLYVVSWSPYSSVALMAFAGYGDMLTPYMKTVPAVIAKASAIHNPIIYAITHPKYRKVIAESIPCLGVLLRVPKRELLSLHSQLSSAHFAITRHASDMSGTFPCSRIVKFHLSPMSNSESAWTYHPQGWTDTEADVAGRSLQPASQQTYCSVNNGPAKLTDLTPCSSSSFRSRHKTLDSGIFEKAGGSIDGTLSRGDTGCITSKIYGSKSTSILTSMRCNVYSQGSTGTIGKGSASRESPDGVQQGAVFHSTAAEMPTSCHPEASVPH